MPASPSRPPSPPLHVRQICDRDRSLLAMPALPDQLPVVFENGLQIDEFDTACSRCGHDVAASSTHGAVTRPTSRLVVFELIAVCQPCRFGTPVLLRVHDTGEFSTRIGSQWFTGRFPRHWRDRLHDWWRRPSQRHT